MSILEHDENTTKPECRPLTTYDIQQFVLERFEDVKKEKKMKELVHFHSINKYLLMSYDVNGLNKLGNIVANHKDKKFKEIIQEYDSVLRNTLEKSPTIKSNSNTLYHIFGHFSKKLSTQNKNHFLDLLQEYHSGEIPLEKILTEMKDIVAKLDKKYLIRQTFFLFNIRRASLNIN